MGANYSLKELLQIGERAWNLKRMINQRLGLTSAADTLPQALLEPYTDGGSAGYRIPLDDMLNAYYQVRGWDIDTGMPTPEKLRTLRLDF